MNLNRATIIGNLTRDPETRTTPNGQQVCKFGVATSQVWKDAAGTKQERVEFHNIVAWAKLAETCQKYLGKGRKVYVEGRLQTSVWDDKTHPEIKHNRTEIIAENMIMLDKAPQGAAQGAAWAPAMQTASGPAVAPKEDEVKVEDIPF